MTLTEAALANDQVTARRAGLSDARRLLIEGRHAEAIRLLGHLVIDLGQPVESAVATHHEQRLMQAYGLVMLAQSYLATGRAADALELATEADQQLAALDDGTDAVHRLRRSCSHALALAHAQVGDHQAASAHYQRLVRSFRTVLTGGSSIEDEAQLALILEDSAQSSMAIGRADAAIDALMGAVRRWRRMGVTAEAPLDHRRRYVRCLTLLADFERARGNLRDSTAFRNEARPIAETLPAEMLSAPPAPVATTTVDETLPAPRVRAVYGNPSILQRLPQRGPGTSTDLPR